MVNPNHVKSQISHIFHVFSHGTFHGIFPLLLVILPSKSHRISTRPAMAFVATWPSTARSWVPWPGRKGSKGGWAENAKIFPWEFHHEPMKNPMILMGCIANLI